MTDLDQINCRLIPHGMKIEHCDNNHGWKLRYLFPDNLTKFFNTFAAALDWAEYELTH